MSTIRPDANLPSQARVHPSGCPYLTAFQAPEAVATPADSTQISSAQPAPPKVSREQKTQTLTSVSHQAAVLATGGASYGAPTIVTAEQASSLLIERGVEFRRQGRGLDFWNLKWKPATAEQAATLAAQHQTLQARLPGGEWGAVQNVQELARLLNELETAARMGETASPSTLAAAGQTAALQAAATTAGPAGAAVAQAATCPFHVFFDPPRVGRLDFVSGLRRHFKNPVRFFDEYHGKHGESFQVKMTDGHRFLFDSRSEVVSAALMHTDHGTNEWEKPPLQGHGLSFLLGTDNVFLGKGDTWRQAHEVMKPHLNGKAINTDATVGRIGDILDGHMEDIKSRLRQSPQGEIEVDLRTEMQKATLDVAMQVLLGTKLQPQELDKVQHSFQVMMGWLSRETLNPTNISLSNLPGTGPLREAYATLNDLGDRVIAERRKSGNPGNDLLGGLLQAKDPQTGQHFSDERLRHEALTIILAGHETTATLLSWTFEVMARHPEEYQRVQSEVDLKLGGKAPTFEQLNHLSTVQNAVKETLRLYSPAYFLVREAARDTTVGPPEASVQVPKGTTLVMSTFHTHRDEDRWGVKATGFPANEFHPDRFVKGHGKMFPFGAGERVCLGQHLARNEAALMLARFVQNFDIVPTDKPIDIRSDISVHPQDTTIRLRLRQSPPAP